MKNYKVNYKYSLIATIVLFSFSVILVQIFSPLIAGCEYYELTDMLYGERPMIPCNQTQIKGILLIMSFGFSAVLGFLIGRYFGQDEKERKKKTRGLREHLNNLNKKLSESSQKTTYVLIIFLLLFQTLFFIYFLNYNATYKHEKLLLENQIRNLEQEIEITDNKLSYHRDNTKIHIPQKQEEKKKFIKGADGLMMWNEVINDYEYMELDFLKRGIQDFEANEDQDMLLMAVYALGHEDPQVGDSIVYDWALYNANTEEVTVLTGINFEARSDTYEIVTIRGWHDNDNINITAKNSKGESSSFYYHTGVMEAVEISQLNEIEESEPDEIIKLTEGTAQFEYQNPFSAEIVIMEADFPANTEIKYSSLYDPVLISVDSKDIFSLNFPIISPGRTVDKYTTIENPYLSNNLFRTENFNEGGVWRDYTTSLLLDEGCASQQGQEDAEPPCSYGGIGEGEPGSGKVVFINYVGDESTIDTADDIMSTFRFVSVEEGEW